MKFLTKIIDYLKKSFKLPEDPKISHVEELAFKNIISVAKERIWLYDPMSTQEYDTDNFDDRLCSNSIENIKKSISVTESYICKYKSSRDE